MAWIKFAPLNIPLNRRLQTAAVVQWVFSFLFLAQCGLALYVWLALHWWQGAVLYAIWLYLDWETPQTGGRRSPWIRSWPIWRHFRDYFPIQTCDLEPDTHYLFGFHPHGILVAGAFGNFCTEYTGFRKLFPGMTPYLHVLPVWFRFPFFREYLMSSGVVSCSKKSLMHVLSQKGGGNVSIIVIGGAAESLEARPGSLILETLNRKGFIRIALKCGAHLVPVFSFGENELFEQLQNPPGSLVRRFQEGLRKTVGFSLPLFHGRGVFQYSYGIIPYRRAIYTVVGRPIPVQMSVCASAEEVDQLHARYLEALSQLFEEHKGQHGIQQHRHLLFT
ncbi:2-acylglycerol O-acyltransferase 1-like isoform X2 [Sardina pilchardus]|uniref:2-acylglycerol O-acyltransferase 1-like isoform X2 n=1 Tax=Sardina pilchardus TaxID=27697 RepID=UPI002E1623FF